MKRIIVLAAVFVFICSGCIKQLADAVVRQPAPEGYVRLAITETDVNLRPLPQVGGKIAARANTGDVFIAEQWPIENTTDKSQWYRIVFALKADGSIVPLSAADKRFKAGSFPFVSANYAKVSPVTTEEDAAIRTIPYSKKDNGGLGKNLPDIVRKFGPGEISRTFNVELIEHFGGVDMLHAEVNLPGLEGFLWENLEGEYELYGKSFTLTKPGMVCDGIAIATPGFGKADVSKLMQEQWKTQPEITKRDDGECWAYIAEMWDCDIVFDEQGLVKSYRFRFSTGS
ncbi:hypothetical protein LJC36_00850 [Desulfovibrio sp. OttesenSCG-928-C14]|nr:hypothetical protein [Desulfovibrio sp. OttesenSCG-928-C14]